MVTDAVDRKVIIDLTPFVSWRLNRVLICFNIDDL